MDSLLLPRRRSAAWGRRLAASLALGTVLLASPVAKADFYDEAFARASARERDGDLAGAAGELELLLALGLYPQDYDLPLRLGAIHLRRGHLADAERAYRLALSRSPDGIEAMAGLALTFSRTNRCDEASTLFARVQASAPEYAASLQAISGCVGTKALWVTPALSIDTLFYRGSSAKSAAVGGTVGLDLAHRTGFHGGGTYRYLEFLGTSTGPLATWAQHEGHFRTGYSVPRFGLGLRYAVVHDGSELMGTSHHGGVDVRYSPLGDLRLSASVSAYSDLTVLRAEPSWRIPVAWGLSLRPALGVQWARPTAYVSGSVTALFHHEPIDLWFGGKGGPERRPAYMMVNAIYNIREEVEFGIFAGGSVNGSAEFRIHARYSMDRLKSTTNDSTQDVHAVSMAISKTF